MAKKAGSAPTMNMIRHGFQPSPSMPSPSAMPKLILIMAAVILPTAESVCNQPSACARARSGMTSATSATPTANSPPTPKPVKKRYKAKSHTPTEKALRPVNMEYIRIVISMTLARPMRSPRMPKNNPPVAQPTMKIEVA
jgi:hypothetical protein